MKRMYRLALAAGLMAGLAACQDQPVATAAPEDRVAAEGRRGWIFLGDGTPLEVGFTVIDGRAIHEGDIDLGPADEVPPTREALLRTRSGACSGGERGPRCGSVIDAYGSTSWAWGTVPYEINGFTTAQRQVILDAIAHIQATTGGTTFVPRNGQGDYVRFTSGSGCSSPVGRRGGRQDIELAAGCFVMGTVAHEILHSLGMWHEQSRCDRDSFVSIQSGNIESGESHNFDKKCPHPGWIWSPAGGQDVLGYDEGSVMHYGATAFSKNGLPTIVSLRGRAMGQRTGLSQTDASTVNLMYRPYSVQGVSVSYPGGVPTISWSAYGRGSIGAYVNLIVVYEEYNDMMGTSNIYDFTSEWVGYAPGTSIQDGTRQDTGTNRCMQWMDAYGSASYAYYYEVASVFPDNVLGTPVRYPASVATC